MSKGGRERRRQKFPHPKETKHRHKGGRGGREGGRKGGRAYLRGGGGGLGRLLGLLGGGALLGGTGLMR